MKALAHLTTEDAVAAHNARVRAERTRGNAAASDEAMAAYRQQTAEWAGASASRTAKQSAPKLIRQSSKGPNKTESAFENDVLYWRKLRGEIARYHPHDSVTLRLANGVRYTADYTVIELDGRTTHYEVKAERRGKWNPVQDDAAVKIKTAATIYPDYKFVLVWKQGGRWQEQEVK